jgi:hypothetical protein
MPRCRLTSAIFSCRRPRWPDHCVHRVGLYHWRASIDIASQTLPVDAQFASAYGQLNVDVDDVGAWTLGLEPGQSFSTVQGLKATGVVEAGPSGSGSACVSRTTGAPAFAAGVLPFNGIVTQIDGARYAMPSFTGISGDIHHHQQLAKTAPIAAQQGMYRY